MKRVFSLAIALMAAFSYVSAQNVQLHYDLGHSLYNDLGKRPSVCTTFAIIRSTSGAALMTILLADKPAW